MAHPPDAFLARLPEPPRKVAVLRASRIGDFICATPALRALRAGLPGAEISLITLPMLADLARRLPSIDRFIPFPGFPGIADQLFDAQKTVQFFNNMLTEQIDLAVQMQGSGVYSNPFVLLLGARYTAGFTRAEAPDSLLDASLPFPAAGHEIDRLLALTGRLGLPAHGRQTDFPLLEEDRAVAQALLDGLPRPWIAIHPYAHSRTRRWPLERFVALSQDMHKQYGGTILVLAGPEQADLAAQVAQEIGPPARSLAGLASLPQTGAILEQCALLVTNDSGPAHIAYALRIPTVILWGGEDLERYGPPFEGPFRVLVHPIDCRPCSAEDCPIHFRCLEHLTVKSAFQAAVELLG